MSTVLLVALALAAAAGAQVGFDARHAAGGLHRAGGLVPVHVELANPSGDDLEVRLEGGGEGLPQAVRDLELAAGSRKQLTFYLGPAGWEHDFEVRLWRGDELLHETLLSSSPVTDEPAVGLFGNHPLGWNTLRRNHQFEGFVGQLEAATLPDFAVGLRAYRLLIWPRPQPRRLRPEQTEALEHWMLTGGHLVLAAAEVPPNEAVAPWTRVRTEELLTTRDLASLAAFGRPPGPWREPLAVARLRATPGEVLLREAWGPVAVRQRRGVGSVTVLGFDPSDPRLAGWAGLGELWLDLLKRADVVAVEENVRHFSSQDPLDLRARAVALLSHDPSAAPPPVKALLIVLGLYLLAIGPGEYLLLRRWRRLTWTWVTFPLWVTLFSAGAYAIAAGARGETLSVRHLLQRDVFPGELVVEELHGSVFAPRPGEYRLSPRWPRGLALTRGVEDGGWGWPTHSSVVRLRGGTGVFAASTRTGAPAMRLLLERRIEQGPAALGGRLPRWSFLNGSFGRAISAGGRGVEAEMRWQGEELAGRLTPRLGSDFDGALLLAVRDGQVRRFELGPLADGVASAWSGAGEAFTGESVVEAVLRSGSQRPLSEWIRDLEIATARRLLDGLVPEAEGAVGSGSRHPYYRYRYQAVDLSRGPHPEHDWSGLLLAGRAVLIAWTTDRDAHFTVGDAEVVSDGLTVFRVPLPVGGSV